MERRIGKRDMILLAIVFVLAFLLWGGYRLSHRGSGDLVQVTVDGSVYGTYALDQNQEITIAADGVATNTLVIENGKADMISADCPDKLCVHQKAISKNGETIVCLPNKVVAEVISDTSKNEFDVIAK